MNNNQIASLVLNNVYGFSNNANKTSTTWNNINLRTLLGDMYDKYDTFNICLDTVTSASSLHYIYATPNDTQVNLRLSGLPLINNTYNIGSVNNGNTNLCTIGSFTFGLNTVSPLIRFTASIGSNSSTLTMVTASIPLTVGTSIQFLTQIQDFMHIN